MASILLVDDEEGLRMLLGRQLRRASHEVTLAEDGLAAVALLEQQSFDLVISDMKMPRLDGMGLLARAARLAPATEFVILTGHGSLENTVEAFKTGNVFDYLLKPLDDIQELNAVVARALERRQLRSENVRLIAELQQRVTELERAHADIEAINQHLEAALRKANTLAAQAELDSQTKSVLLAAIPSIIISLDGNNRIIQWNSAAERTFGIQKAQVLGQPLSECGICWDWPRISQYLQSRTAEDKPRPIENVQYTRTDRTEGLLGMTLIPVPSPIGERAGALLLGADITERRQLETHLAHAQKMESIGQLAAGIAHEINTPTQFIGDNLRFLKEAFQDLGKIQQAYTVLLRMAEAGPVPAASIQQVKDAEEEADMEYLMQEAPRAIDQALEGTERVAKIVGAMKEFSHPGAKEKTCIDLNRAIESTVTVARNEWKYVAEMVMDLDPALPPAPCLPGEINQVVLNLLINAAHAIRDVVGKDTQQRGRITVSTRRVEEGVEIRISDTGAGIPEAIRAKVFDPFFTTKTVGKGTGQGLAIAHSVVVDKHGGSIHFETQEGVGTTFVIRLPIK